MKNPGLTMRLPIRAITLNTAKCPVKVNGKIRFITNPKIKGARKVIRQILFYTQKNQLYKFFKDFDVKKNEIWISAKFGFNDFYTKSGEISSRVCDLSNAFKVIEDEIFSCIQDDLPKIDDKLVTQLILKKEYSEKDFVEVSFFIAERYEGVDG
jgi:hypothetical protein